MYTILKFLSSPFRSFFEISHHVISRIRQDFQRFLEISGFHKDIIRIESGYRKNSNAIFCKNSREFRKNTYKRKIKYTLNTESSPSIILKNSSPIIKRQILTLI